MTRAANKDFTEMTPIYEVLVDDIKALGVEQVFGLMSDDTAVFATALDSSGIRFYGARHENNAIAMAEGYAYRTGGLGVAVIGRGPATANGLHAATYASRTGSRVLIIYGEAAVRSAPPMALGPDYKGFNATGVLRRRRHPHLRRDQPRDRARRAGRCRRGGAAEAARRRCCCRSTSSWPRSTWPRRTAAAATPRRRPPRRRAAAGDRGGRRRCCARAASR